MAEVENILFKVMKTYGVIIDEEDYRAYDDSDLITYTSVSGNTHSIPKDLVYDLIAKDEYYKYFERMVNSSYYNLKIVCVGKNEILKEVSISIADAIRVIKDKIILNEEEQKKLDSLIQKCSKENLIEKSRGKKFSYILEGENITVDENDFLEVFLSSQKEFKYYTNQESLFGVENRKFFYGLNKYLTENKIIRKYTLPNMLITRNMRLKNFAYVDYESFNITKVAKDSIYDVELTDELKQQIYKDMPEAYDGLEKAIYVYIMLCKTFSYDHQYFIADDREKYGKKYKDIARIGNIKSGDNTLVCYEFNAIYSKFLEHLNIKHHVNSNSDIYGKGHTSIVFKENEYIVMTDAVTSIFSGDLINAKLNIDLDGIKCLNVNATTKYNFENKKEEIYKYIKENCDYRIDLKDFLRINKKEEEKKDFTTKIMMIIEQIHKSKLKPMDNIGYLTRLTKIFFTTTELKKNVSVIVLKENIHGLEYPAVVICINENGDMNKDKNNKYYKYDLKGNIEEVSKESLEKDFKSLKLEYLESHARRIPQVNIKKKGDR